MGSVDLLSDFADVIGASSTNTSTAVNPSSATLEKSPNSGLCALYYMFGRRSRKNLHITYVLREHSKTT